MSVKLVDLILLNIDKEIFKALSLKDVSDHDSLYNPFLYYL